MEYIVNPQTGRKIKVGGPTYMKIKDRYNWDFVTPLSKKPEPTQVAPKRRGSVTRGWAEDAPKRGYPRHLLKEQCGDKCFLMPETEKFPICPKCIGKKCSCQIDCRGLYSAKIRAHQYKYTNLYNEIDNLIKENCGGT